MTKLYRVWFDGYELTEHLTVNHIYQPMMASIDNKSHRTPTQNGAKYIRSRIDPYQLEMEVTIKDNVLFHLEELNKILYTREEKPLIINDRDDRYLMCKLDGGVIPSSRRYMSKFVLKFVSSLPYWHSTEGTIRTTIGSGGFNRLVLDNKGTAPTYPRFKIDVLQDTGYIGVVAPNGYIALGDINEPNKLIVPPSEYAMNEELHELNTWRKIGNVETYVPDYVKATSTGEVSFNPDGFMLKESSLGSSDQWHGAAYMKDFEEGQIEKFADNFEYRSRIEFRDRSGTTSRTGAILAVIFDDNNMPIMTTSIYDVGGGSNKLNVTFKVRDGNTRRSKIIHSGTLEELYGFFQMEKMGNSFRWIVHHNGSTVQAQTSLKVGDTVYIKDSAVYGWHYNGTRYPIAGFTRGRPNQITRTRTFQGRTQYEIAYNGVVIYWMDANDLRGTATSFVNNPMKQISHTYYSSELGQLRPAKLMLWMAKWGNTRQYSNFILTSAVVKRLYSNTTIDIPNTFMKGDTVEIDNANEMILHNDIPIQADVDLDSRFFSIDGGKTEIAIHGQNSSHIFGGYAEHESRYL